MAVGLDVAVAFPPTMRERLKQATNWLAQPNDIFYADRFMQLPEPIYQKLEEKPYAYMRPQPREEV